MAIDKKELIRAVKVFNKDRDVDDKIPTDLEDRDMMEKFVEKVNKVNEDGGDIPEKCVEVYNSEWLQGAMAGDEVIETEVENEKKEIDEMGIEKTEVKEEEKAVESEVVKEATSKNATVKGKKKSGKVTEEKEATPKTTKEKKRKERETVSSFDTSEKATNIKAAKEAAKEKVAEKKAASGIIGGRKRTGVGTWVVENIKSGKFNGKTNKEIADLANEELGCLTNASCIGWYKFKINKGEK